MFERDAKPTEGTPVDRTKRYTYEDPTPLMAGREATAIYIPVSGETGEGEPGPPGPVGPKGTGEPGPAGKSAYQSWLSQGHVGTESQFLAWLKGKDGVSPEPAYLHLIFKLTANGVKPDTPSIDFLQEGWSNTMQDVSEMQPYQWISSRFVKAGVGDPFSVPAVFTFYSQRGGQGLDGKSLEFVFRAMPTEELPSTPVDLQGAANFVPPYWSRAILSTSEDFPYVFCTKREREDGIWGPYDPPALWAKYSKNGINGADGANGTNGLDGTNGTNGTNGVDGTNGRSIAVYHQATEPVGGVYYDGDLWIYKEA